jgi:hypothetical protein
LPTFLPPTTSSSSGLQAELPVLISTLIVRIFALQR